jgi:hypothetical protein
MDFPICHTIEKARHMESLNGVLFCEGRIIIIDRDECAGEATPKNLDRRARKIEGHRCALAILKEKLRIVPQSKNQSPQNHCYRNE